MPVSSLVPQTTGFTLKIRRGGFHLEVFLTASIEWSIRTCLPGKAMKSLSFWVFENNGLSWLKQNLYPVRSLSLKEIPVWGFFGCPCSCVELRIAQKKANTLNVQVSPLPFQLVFCRVMKFFTYFWSQLLVTGCHSFLP